MIKLQWAKQFKKDFKKNLGKDVQNQTKKQFQILKINSRHPSLRIKKTKGEVLKEYKNVFEGRITKNHRFFFLIISNVYLLLRCGDHDDFLK